MKKTWISVSYLTVAGLSLAGLPVGAVQAKEQLSESHWQVFLGAGVVSMPEYPGSDDQETVGVPLISVNYKRFFLGGTPGSPSPGGLGLYLYQGDSLSIGAALSHDIDDPREESDDARLRGLGDIDASTHGTLFMNYERDWYSMSASVSSDIGDKGQGTVAKLEAEASYQLLPRLQLTAGPGVTFADGEHMQTFFGVDQQQASASRFNAYEADSGLTELEFSVGARYQFSPHLGLGVNFTAGRLQGDAADSPIVEDKNQNRYGAFLMYRF